MKTTVHFHISLYFLCTVILLAFFGCSKKITNNHPPKFSFTRSSQSFDAVNTHQIDLGDLDGDGDLDAVFASFNHGRVLLNDGSGNFTDTGQLLARYGHGVEIGDLDRDGDLDIFMINNNLQLNERSAMVYFNDGAGLFEDSGQDLGDSERNGLGVQLIDIDNDNDLDAHVNYNQGESILYMNNGEGVFQKSEQVCPSGTWGDLDGDGDVDVFVKIFGEGYRSLLNDGAGQLTECWQIQDNTVLYGAIAPIDIDGDVDLDAVVGNYDNARSDSTRIFMNDGTGAFTMVAQKLRPTAWGKFALGDLNGDGRTDVFVSNFNLPNEIWLNEEGHLTDSGERLGGNEPSGKSALGDLDNDGDLDLFVAFFGEGSNSVWFNNSN